MAAYVPRKGDFISLYLGDHAGHEQQGRRPALVISNDRFNEATGMCIACPVTNTRRDYPFHVAVPDGEPVTGVVMVDQLRSFDCRGRKVKRIGAAPASVVEQALAVLDACVY